MALVPANLALQLNALAQENLSPEQANIKFAEIITNYIKTAQVVGQGMGANGGGPITTVVTGSLQ